MRIPCAVLGTVFFVAASVCLCVASDDDVSLIQVPAAELTGKSSDPECDRRALMSKVNELGRLRGSSEYQTMLAFGFRRDGDGFSRVLSSSALRERLPSNGEAAAFATEDGENVMVAAFREPSNVNRFLRVQSACQGAYGKMCRAVLYRDGGKDYCLVFTEKELSR